MTGRAVLVMDSPDNRARARHWIERAPQGTRIEFKGPQRSVEANAKLWAALTDVAVQKTHAGRKYSTNEWKILFMHACGREVQFMPALDNSTFVPYGNSSSDLSKEEFSDLLTFIIQWGDEAGVVWSDPKEIALRELETRAPRQVEQQETKLLTHQKENAT